MGDYIPHIPEWFNTRKAAQAIAYLASKNGGTINILRVSKLLYLSDRLSMERREFPITGDEFVSMPFGPVNSFTYSYINGVAPVRREAWAEYVSPRKGYLVSAAKEVVAEELTELSRGDLRIIDDTWDTFKDIVDQFELANWTHDYCPEWRDPNGSSVTITVASIYKHLGKADPFDLAEQMDADRRYAAGLANGKAST